MQNQSIPLTDEQMRDFIINGFIKVKTDFPPSFHEQIYQHLDVMFEHTGNLGNNVLPLIPEIQQVFDHPVVDGAMRGVLGTNYIMHPHRFCHYNPIGGGGQGHHKDSYEGDEQVRRHRCRWSMGFYYPQDVTEDMGPTAVLPGSQYYDSGESAHEHPELSLCGEAGTVTIVHYDLWHRAMANESDKKRYMLKFLFSRLDEPRTPTWQSDNVDWQTVADGVEPEHPELWESQWDWYYGNENGCANGVPYDELVNLLDTLQHDNEKMRLNAAYRLGRVGVDAVPVLQKALYSSNASIQNYAGYALSLVGSSAVSVLIDGLQESDESVRTTAAYALADMGKVAQEAVPALTRAAKDESPWVRRHAIEGLGIIGQQMEEGTDLSQAVSVITEGLRDEYYWVRYNAARTLAILGPLSEPALPDLMAQLEDENRYVRFNAALALKQIDTPEAREVLFSHLFSTRWCALSTRDTPF